MNQNNPHRRNLLLLVFLCGILMFNACKKDNKQEETGYELRIVSGNNSSNPANAQTTTPLIVAVYKNGRQLSRNDFYQYSVSLNNFVCGSEELSDFNAVYQPDGTVQLDWFTGETEGKQRVAITLKDEAGNSLARTEANISVTPNPNGWHAACMKPEGLIVAAGERFLLLKDGQGWSSKDGKVWIPWGSPGYGNSSFLGEPGLGADVIYHKQRIYAMLPSYEDNQPLFTSVDAGKTWELVSNFPKYCRLLAVINEETLIVSFPGGLSAITYKDGKSEKTEPLIPMGGFIQFTTNNAFAFALDRFGGLYRANGYNGKYTLVNEELKLDKILVKDFYVYGFSGTTVYRSADNGSSFMQLAQIPVPDQTYIKLEDVKFNGNRFYMIHSNGSSFNLSSPFSMTSTSDWLTYTDAMLVNHYYFNPVNFCIIEDGTTLLQTMSQSLIYKKP